MSITIEWIYKDKVAKIGILRFGRKHFKYGDPYEFTCTVKIIKNTVHLYGGLSDKNSLTNFFRYKNKIKDIFTEENVTQVVWERIKNNRKKIYKVKLPELEISTEITEVS